MPFLYDDFLDFFLFCAFFYEDFLDFLITNHTYKLA